MVSIDPVAKLELVGEFIETVPTILLEVKKATEVSFARDLLNLFEIFEQLEVDLLTVVTALRDFTDETDIGMRVHIIHGTEEAIEKLQRTSTDILQWLRRREQWSSTFAEVCSPEVRRLFSYTGMQDSSPEKFHKNKEGYSQSFDLVVILNTLRYELQAIRSPDPRLFPDPDRLEEIVEQGEQLLSELQQVENLMREFASTSLKVEDFFRSAQEFHPRSRQIASGEVVEDFSISLDLLRILRCPACVSNPTRRETPDPGLLELVNNTWLVCQEEGCGLKYPICDGIPIMPIEVGEKWKYTPIEVLPVPPPSLG